LGTHEKNGTKMSRTQKKTVGVSPNGACKTRNPLRQTTRISTLAALASKSATCCVHVIVYHFSFTQPANPFAFLLSLEALLISIN
jgi:hypothetical protein